MCLARARPARAAQPAVFLPPRPPRARSYELLLLPDERHVPRAPKTKAYVEARIRKFFVESVKNA